VRIQLACTLLVDVVRRSLLMTLPPATSFAASLSVAADATSRFSSYVGPDWMFTADACADYSCSEALGPFLLLAQPGHDIRVACDASHRTIAAGVFAHAPGSRSTGLDAHCGGVFLYFDPLSQAGRAIASLAESAEGVATWALPAAVRWTPHWFDRLAHGAASAAEVAEWVDGLREALIAATGAGQDDTSRRLAVVADALGGDPSGRVDCPELAARVHWSPGYLRRMFRLGAGMTMSRYQAWRRIHRTFVLISRGDAAGTRRGMTTATLHEAGFYDAPHGFKSIRQYLGMDPAEALYPTKYCEQASRAA